MPDDSNIRPKSSNTNPSRSNPIPNRTDIFPGSADADIALDIRRLIDLVERLLDQETAPIAEPIEQMLADLQAIHDHMAICASAMLEAAKTAGLLLDRQDPMPELTRLHARLDSMGWENG